MGVECYVWTVGHGVGEVYVYACMCMGSDDDGQSVYMYVVYGQVCRHTCRGLVLWV